MKRLAEIALILLVVLFVYVRIVRPEYFETAAGYLPTSRVAFAFYASLFGYFIFSWYRKYVEARRSIDITGSVVRISINSVFLLICVLVSAGVWL